jgi:hypothetical protein
MKIFLLFIKNVNPKVIGKKYSSIKHHNLEGIDIKIIHEIDINSGDLLETPSVA